MKRLVLCFSIAASILAGCASSAPSATPTQGTASTPAPGATQGAAPSPAGALGGIVNYQLDGLDTTTEVNAVADGSSVSGTAVTTSARGTHTVSLECAARGGDTWAFGGTVEQSTMPGEGAGYWSAVIVRDGSPQQVGIWLSDDKVAGMDCDGWLAAIDMSTIDASNLNPIESGELVPPPDLASASSSRALIASGTFRFPPMHADVELEATRHDSDVTGTMTVSNAEMSFTVDLECTLTAEDGRILIGGDTTESTFDTTPNGTRTAIVLKPGSPAQAIFAWQSTDQVRAPSCMAFLEDQSPDAVDLVPIEGTVELGG